MKLLVQASACTYHEKREEINFKTSVRKQHKERLRQKRGSIIQLLNLSLSKEIKKRNALY